jgi:hypothetical protein
VDELAAAVVTTGSVWTFATVVNPNARPPLSASLASGDNFLVTFPSQLGQTYRVETTDNLAPPDWQAVTSNVPGSGSAIPVLSPGVSSLAQRFYRVLILPP